MKHWFITGISSGLGKALAEAVIEKGDFVIGTFRQQSQVNAFNSKYKDKAYSVLLDITDSKNIEKCIAQTIIDFGKIDVLVNNAGLGFVGAIEETSTEEVKHVFDANFHGTLKITQSVLPYMRKARQGHIVQISSHGGLKAFAGFGIYNASKFALEGFSEALAQEVDPLGIKVLIVEPGPFRTKFADKGLGIAKTVIDDYSETAGAFKAKLKSINGKQEGDPIKAAHAIIDVVYSKNKTLRLPLGKIALKTIKMKIDSINTDLDINKLIAENSVYE